MHTKNHLVETCNYSRLTQTVSEKSVHST